MSPSLTTTAPKLAKLLLLLGSNHDGEVVAAARAIERRLHDAGHYFRDLVNCLHLPTPTQSDARSKERNDEQSMIWWCFRRRHLLATHDRHFIETLVIWHNPLSPKEHTRLCEICETLQPGAAA